ncbi:MAG TPA: hypothetical protein VHI72_02850 [Hyphomicrobiaceae bacterium]|jgi:selenocysteine-specific translation elongation factor|nr:hypothetical protein [Hyphomicrobiaceae bacterium]
MIVGTAGLIDHGKTSLVRQLAGVDEGKGTALGYDTDSRRGA